MAVVQGLGGDAGNGLHRPGHAQADGVVLIQPLHQVGEHLPVRVVLDHADLLADDPLLLVHALLGEVGDGDEGEEGLQVLLKLLGALEVVPGDGVAGKGVGGGPVGRQLLEGVALPGVEHLVLQVVGHPGGGVVPGPVQAEPQVHTAVVCGEKGVALLKLGLGKYKHVKAVLQHLPVHPLPHPWKIQVIHGSSPLLSVEEIDGVQLQLLGGGGHLLPGDGLQPLHQLLNAGVQAGRRLAQPELLQAALVVQGG